MAFGKYSRIDNRKSSSYSSTGTIIVFVAICLVGVWMMTSSSVVPVDESSKESKSELKVSETDSRQFEDTPGDLPSNGMKEDSATNENGSPEESDSDSSQEQNLPDKTTENSVENTQDSDTVKDNEDRKDESDDAPKTETYKDENGNTDDGETIKEGGEVNKGDQEGGQEKSAEKNFEGSTTTEQEKITEQVSGEPARNEQEKDTEQSSDGTANDEQKTGSEQNSEEYTNNGQEKDSEQTPNKSVKDEQEQYDNAKSSEQGEKSRNDAVKDEMDQSQVEEKSKQNQEKDAKQDSNYKESGDQVKDQGLNEVFPDGSQAELLNETTTQNGQFSTQSASSKNEKEVQASSSAKGQLAGLSWKLCNTTSGADYIPCLDNEEAIRKLRSTKHYEHRERHCPEEGPTCLVPLPEGYKRPIQWPNSRDKIWYFNVPHTKLAVVKGHQNWVKVTGEYLTFPGGGTQFKNGALHYIDSIQEALPDIAWGKRSRVVLDVGCGVASFGGYLFDRDVLTMSFAPKDEHEAQVQFALERGIPAISAVMGTKRLPYPSRVFDVIHCARCRVPWHIEGGNLLLELNRLLRPGGYFVWSATPVYQSLPEDVEIWEAMTALTKSMCWNMVTKSKDALNQVGIAIYQKPFNNDCYEKRTENSPPLCQESDDPNAAWNVPLQACMHRLPVDLTLRGSQWPEQWPHRLEKTPYWLNNSQVGVYGKPAPKDFETDYEHWKTVVSKSYVSGMGIDWSTVRNVMDMRSVYGGFAAALRDMKVWVLNVVSIDSPDTLPIIYERGLFGMYHDWCESFSSYPRTYDLLHADHLFSRLRKRCKLQSVMAEADRLLRPEGKLIVRDNTETISEVENMAKSLHWEIRMTFSKEKEGLLCVQKTMWRPRAVETSV